MNSRFTVKRSRTTARPPAIKGLFQRGEFWYLRYSYGGHQFRLALGTTDRAEAEILARQTLDNPVQQAAKLFTADVKDYCAAGGIDGRMTENTKNVAQDCAAPVRG
jgi:hypothetical protein